MKNIMKNIGSFSLLVAIHTIFFFFWMLAIAPRDPIGGLIVATWALRYVAAIFSAYLIYGVWKIKCNSFVLPMSFLPLPFIYYFLLSQARNYLDVYSDPEGWEIAAFSDTLIFSLPFFVITFILSSVFEAKKCETKQSRKKLLIVVAAVSVLLCGMIAAFLLSLGGKSPDLVTSFELNDTITAEQLNSALIINGERGFQFIDDAEKQRDFEQLFGVVLPELNYKKYEYYVEVDLDPDWIDGRRELSEEQIIYIYKMRLTTQ